jgi:hypothetical protein
MANGLLLTICCFMLNPSITDSSTRNIITAVWYRLLLSVIVITVAHHPSSSATSLVALGHSRKSSLPATP